MIKDLLDNNIISQEEAESLGEFEGQIKEASLAMGIKNLAKAIVPHALGAGIAHYGVGKLNERSYRKMREEDLARVQASKNKMFHEDPSLSKVRSQAEKRLNEIAHFSPTVASMPEVASKIIKRTLSNGLSEMDIKNLVEIEVGNAQSRNLRTPKKGYLQTTLEGIAGEVSGAIRSSIDDAPVQLITGGFGGPEGVVRIFDTLQNRGVFSGRWNDVDTSTPEGRQLLSDLMDKDPDYIASKIKSEGLERDVASMLKQGSDSTLNFDGIDEVAKVKILADQYSLEKVAKSPGLTLGGSLLGLGAAALFGGASSALEQYANHKRSREMNNKISNSWKSTRSALRKMTEDGAAASAGVDFRDNENLRKAEEAFRTLSDVAPSVAANSNLATNFVVRTVQNEGMIDHDVVKSLSEIQKNLNTTKQYRSPFLESPTIQGFSSGFAGAGGSEFLKNVGIAIAQE